ncbi:MAG: type II toxin-antitoxin system HicA family toxin [Pyrinomonadaceae bacterium]
MKRRELIKILTDMGCVLVRSGGKHDWYTNPQTKQSQPVPRHNEINEFLAKSIIKKLRSEELD